ncbi:MAG TPA: twin-arginine translocase TatA/TatE family subunit [Acidimicrobiales bacterium]|nr:twin-arginine translocase TatA/TatE family subunit [Acidimicrobiales bacterium]
MGGLLSAKFLVVLVIALIVLGPEKLPETARTLGRWVSELRRITTGFTEEVRSAFETSELAEPVQELRSATQTLRGTTMGLRGAATGWLTAQVLPSENTSSAPGGPDGAGAATAAGSPPRADIAARADVTARVQSGLPLGAAWPEAEFGVPPGDPSLN